MKVTVRGWGRNMGRTEIANFSLLTTEYRDNGTVSRNEPVLYDGPGNITVAWFQSLKLTGNYRMEVQLTGSDVMSLFKCYFGSELGVSLVERYGLTFSPELVKSILRTVKLSDITLGELAAMQSVEPTTTEKVAKPTNVTPLLRRV